MDHTFASCGFDYLIDNFTLIITGLRIYKMGAMYEQIGNKLYWLDRDR